MPRGRPPKDPSLRNLELYHEVVCTGRSQTDVALRSGISQPRVARICRQINAWLDHVLPLPLASRAPPTPGLSQKAQRFHLAIAFRHRQLAMTYKEFLAHFGGTDGAAAYSRPQQVHDAGQFPADFAARLPPKELIQSAARYARELHNLASIAARGPFSRPPTPSGPESVIHAAPASPSL